MHNDVTRRDAREILVFVVTAGIQTKRSMKADCCRYFQSCQISEDPCKSSENDDSHDKEQQATRVGQ